MARKSDNTGDTTPPVDEVIGYIEPIEINLEMERSFLEYSMSVIVSRALPDARDGLKPVHRRILYSMFDQGLRPDRPHAKCAKVVGEVMGTYHPHGDSAIYDALVRMVQDFAMRHPLVSGTATSAAPVQTKVLRPCATRSVVWRRLRLNCSTPLTKRPSILNRTTTTPPTTNGAASRFPNLLVTAPGHRVGMATKIPRTTSPR